MDSPTHYARPPTRECSVRKLNKAHQGSFAGLSLGLARGVVGVPNPDRLLKSELPHDPRPTLSPTLTNSHRQP